MRMTHVCISGGLICLVALLLGAATLPAPAFADGLRLPATEPGAPPPLLDPSDIERPHTVYDISLHEARDLQLLLGRLEMLASQPRAQTDKPEIALVLHGPELNFFAIRNYAEHQALVDLAAKLDAFQIIEIKACLTKMRELHLEPSDLPGFIELVPLGPEEVRRLEGDGYLKM